jgi:serine/threonine protein kinase
MIADQASFEYCVGCLRAAYVTGQCDRCAWKDASEPERQTHLPRHYVLLDRYYIGKVLGQGGFGITYLARDMRLDRLVAIKEYFPGEQCTRLTDRTRIHPLEGEKTELFNHGLRSFLSEAKAIAKLQGHPNIVSISDFAEENGTAYLVMSFIEGSTLKDHLATKGGQISYQTAIEIILRVLSALRAMHGHNLLHRDVSPSNIIITSQGLVKLVDFGAARLAIGEQSKSLSVIVKPGYAPEEQYRTKGKQGPWTDVYATCATLYQCITGKVPSSSPDRLADDDLEMPSLLCPEISKTAEEALLKGLAVRAVDRFQSVDELQNALLESSLPINHGFFDNQVEVKDGEAEPKVINQSAPGARPAARRLLWLWGALVPIVVGSVVGWLTLTVHHGSSKTQESKATENLKPQAIPIQRSGQQALGQTTPVLGTNHRLPSSSDEPGNVPAQQPNGNAPTARVALSNTASTSNAGAGGAPASQAAPAISTPPMSARPVSAPPSSASPVSLTPIPPGMGVFKDDMTGLTWTSTDNGNDIISGDAEQFCNGLRLGGYDDWRLPGIAELTALYDPSNSTQHPNCGMSPGYPAHIKNGIRLGCYSAWSSTRGEDVKMPWGQPPAQTVKTFDYYNGHVYERYRDKDQADTRAICVRGR